MRISFYSWPVIELSGYVWKHTSSESSDSITSLFCLMVDSRTLLELCVATYVVELEPASFINMETKMYQSKGIYRG